MASTLVVSQIEDARGGHRWAVITLSDGRMLNCPKKLAREFTEGLQPRGCKSGDELYESLIPDFIEYAKQKMFDLLSRSDYTTGQIAKKLEHEGLEHGVISEVILYGIELGILDDNRYIDAFALARYERGYGSRYIIEKLCLKGIAPKVTESHLYDKGYDFVESGYRWVSTSVRNLIPFDQPLRKRLLGKLLYRGFSYDEINQIFNKIQRESVDDVGSSYLD